VRPMASSESPADRTSADHRSSFLPLPGVRGDEERVVAAYASWLERNGWTVTREVDFVDVYAGRGEEKPYAEARGRTAAIGLDVDTLYGQLLRRMKDPGTTARYAVVVPTAALNAALRVPGWVRERLHVDIFEADNSGVVNRRGQQIQRARTTTLFCRDDGRPALRPEARQVAAVFPRPVHPSLAFRWRSWQGPGVARSGIGPVAPALAANSDPLVPGPAIRAAPDLRRPPYPDDVQLADRPAVSAPGPDTGTRVPRWDRGR